MDYKTFANTVLILMGTFFLLCSMIAHIQGNILEAVHMAIWFLIAYSIFIRDTD